jgi:cobaltochelatase CobN
MHLLVAQKGSLSDGDEAVDLGQSPGDVLFLSAADTELASIAAARQMTGGLNGLAAREPVRSQAPDVG